MKLIVYKDRLRQMYKVNKRDEYRVFWFYFKAAQSNVKKTLDKCHGDYIKSSRSQYISCNP